jgi:hypothetical protein
VQLKDAVDGPTEETLAPVAYVLPRQDEAVVV